MKIMVEIDKDKDVYLFLHGKMDLQQKSVDALVSNGFSKDKIIMAMPDKVGKEGDYMAMLWMPPNPDHIKIQKITKIEPVEPDGMIGLWKGVSKDDLFEIKLE
jgi:predicted metalloprotease